MIFTIFGYGTLLFVLECVFLVISSIGTNREELGCRSVLGIFFKFYLLNVLLIAAVYRLTE